ncbi:hypothetical protein U9M48_011723 [Paspalum notatum var. saurae]|uniref:Uncharacterized protein n=1 Tax=Paspalum notatum var. saurae TaxID=547442 RepID=A0AAQ3WHZ8_PASNO
MAGPHIAAAVDLPLLGEGDVVDDGMQWSRRGGRQRRAGRLGRQCTHGATGEDIGGVGRMDVYSRSVNVIKVNGVKHRAIDQ